MIGELRGRGRPILEVDDDRLAARELWRNRGARRHEDRSGEASAAMCASSLAPDFGLIGTIATPREQCADDRHARLHDRVGEHRGAPRSAQRRGDPQARVAQLRVGERALRERDRDPLGRPFECVEKR